MKPRPGGLVYTPNPDAGSWIHDARYYQFFNDGADDGTFTNTKVRPGTYTLHVTADGVLGDYAQANITVEPGKTVDLGKLVWTPVRFGRQVWEIGTPDRAADEFFKGDGQNYWLWGWNLRYALLFPNDVTYTIPRGEARSAQSLVFRRSAARNQPGVCEPRRRGSGENHCFGWVKVVR